MSRAYNPKLSAKQNAALDRRYRMVQIQRLSIGLSIVILISLIVFLSSSMKAFAGSSKEELPKNKYYKSITVEAGDSLWSIASENAERSLVDMDEYMDEVRRMNNIHNDEIHSGQTLIVAYYTSEIH